MASIELDEESGNYRIRFRFEGRPFKRSLKTSDHRLANARLGQIEGTLLLIESGRLEVPPDVDPATFIFSDGKRTGAEKLRERLTLKELFDRYQNYHAELPKPVKEDSTLQGERFHFSHLLRHLKGNAAAQSLTLDSLQAYADKRARDKWRGKKISAQTVKKELTTLRVVWNWGVKAGTCEAGCR